VLQPINDGTDENKDKENKDIDGIENNQGSSYNYEILRANELGEPEIIRLTQKDIYDDPIDDIEPKEWVYSDKVSEAEKLAINDVMLEQAGFIWDYKSDNPNLNMMETIELLEKHCYVQVSKLTTSNIRCCLMNDGSVLAYFPEKVWLNILGEKPDYLYEVSGMQLVEIISIDNNIIVKDHNRENGQFIEIDNTSLKLLSENGWILEVYK